MDLGYSRNIYIFLNSSVAGLQFGFISAVYIVHRVLANDS